MESRRKTGRMQPNVGYITPLLILAAIFMVGYVFFSYGLDPKVTFNYAKDPSNVCFSTEDFKLMFSARVSNPDSQLASYLESRKVHPHYPDFQELLETLYHTKKRFI